MNQVYMGKSTTMNTTTQRKVKVVKNSGKTIISRNNYENDYRTAKAGSTVRKTNRKTSIDSETGVINNNRN